MEEALDLSFDRLLMMMMSFKFILVCGGGDLWRIYSYIYFSTWTAVAQWLRCCATNWEVDGLIPNVVIGICQ